MLGSVWGLRAARKKHEQACEKRIEEVKQAIREGYALRQTDDEPGGER